MRRLYAGTVSRRGAGVRIYGVGLRSICLKHDAFQGDDGQDFGQGALLIGQHSAYSKCKVRELKQLLSFLLRSSEAMEDAGQLLVTILRDGSNKLTVCGPGVNHERQVIPDCPLYLHTKSFFLLAGITLVPVVVKPHLAYCNKRVCSILQQSFHVRKHLHEGGGLNVFGMQPKHGETVTLMSPAQVEHGFNAGGIDVRQQDVFDASLTCTLYDVLAVSIEFGFVDMAMCIYHAVQLWRPISSRAMLRSMCLRSSGRLTLSRHASASA